MGIERPSGRRYMNIARSLVAQGHQVRILALHPDLADCPRRRFVQDGVEVWYVGQMHARKTGSLPQRFGPLELLRVLTTSTFGMIWGVICSPSDCYHLGKPQPINGMAALLGIGLLRHQGFYVDCDDDEVHGNRFTAQWQRAIFAFWQHLLPRLAEGVTVNTQHLAEQLGQSGVTRSVYVPNGVDVARFRLPEAQRLAALRGALGLQGRRVVAYVGSLALQNHPVDLLLEAWPLVLASVPTACLLIIGGGEDLPKLQAWVTRQNLTASVRFTGHVPHSAVPTLLSLAEMSVDPVHDDAVARARSPLKLVESMALGVPVITGAVGDREALLAHGRAGVLVEPGSPTALASAIIALLQDDAQRLRLAAAGREQAQRYAWERLAQAWLGVYS
ncbi:glycosyl transferase family 1 [Candidatus Viridilinea mediisalina]|uniref:Glycosyl transferase family 1 n=2 Tax=Candidatus Viridilinea mediisalina TaxID=2024553 RepID=A0A2A6RM30_9CHLR|nr:glycosyl transferase family 1 [Candidatus Viridilinea mediisalina]